MHRPVTQQWLVFRFRSAKRVGFKHSHNFRVPGFGGQLAEGVSLRVAGEAKGGKALEEACCPFNVSAADGVSEVVQFDSEETTHLAEVFDGPASRSGVESGICGVNVCALLHHQLNDGAMSAEGCVVEWGCSGCILLIDEVRARLQNGANFVDATVDRRFD